LYCYSEADVLAMAAAVEKNSRHPLALAVTAAFSAAGGKGLVVKEDSFRWGCTRVLFYYTHFPSRIST
jgi:cation transport ATPase